MSRDLAGRADAATMEPTRAGYWGRQTLFWVEAFTYHGSSSPLVLGRVGIFGVFALIVTALDYRVHWINLGVEVAPLEVAGGALGVLMVLRTNAGYDRWWEARRLWGAIVNQTRALAIAALAYGPADRAWRERFVRWTAAFAHASRRSLRGERAMPEVAALLGPDAAGRLAGAEHMPSAIVRVLADLLAEARAEGLDPYAFLDLDRQRSMLMDHIGGCERILATPLPKAYAILIRRCLILFLATLPFGLMDKVGWITPLLTAVVAYVFLSLDTLSSELQSPFSQRSLNHLPLDQICAKIETNLLALLAADPGPAPASSPARTGNGTPVAVVRIERPA